MAYRKKSSQYFVAWCFARDVHRTPRMQLPRALRQFIALARTQRHEWVELRRWPAGGVLLRVARAPDAPR